MVLVVVLRDRCWFVAIEPVCLGIDAQRCVDALFIFVALSPKPCQYIWVYAHSDRHRPLWHP